MEFMQRYHATFDKFRSKFLVGELIWNFQDFETAQSGICVDHRRLLPCDKSSLLHSVLGAKYYSHEILILPYYLHCCFSDTRVNGQNHKGVFNRDRIPKSSAHWLRFRYAALEQELKEIRNSAQAEGKVVPTLQHKRTSITLTAPPDAFPYSSVDSVNMCFDGVLRSD